VQLISLKQITAVVLAGGLGRRMGGLDKGLMKFRGKPMIESLLPVLEKQGVNIFINANRNQVAYHIYGYHVIGDELEGYQGPLAGFAAVMQMVTTPYIITLPCDGPFLANDYVQRFLTAMQDSSEKIQVAHDGNRLQPVHAMISTNLRSSLDEYLARGQRKIDLWYQQVGYQTVNFSDCQFMFDNINRPQDLINLSRED